VFLYCVGGANSLSLPLDVYQFHYLSLFFAVKKEKKKKRKKKKARETYCLNVDKHEKLPPVDVSL
jgi:hypothetical protein